MDADGMNQTNPTNNSEIDESPRWSHDGTKLLFVSDRYLSNYNIFVMDTDGANQTRLTSNSDVNDSPEWQP